MEATFSSANALGLLQFSNKVQQTQKSPRSDAQRDMQQRGRCRRNVEFSKSECLLAPLRAG
jgi:hypothetical protein